MLTETLNIIQNLKVKGFKYRDIRNFRTPKIEDVELNRNLYSIQN